ncbi:MFS transporter [Dactylosporangium sp. NBC_01737]|uniref:MFS transporter n=1 Tax=Dactylosporangium sp. NBC_01737 TaxID=2975959 RepID=UPI002E12912E|nr:MFS transporter [Dactylosporangium sp. NBC_01737]
MAIDTTPSTTPGVDRRSKLTERQLVAAGFITTAGNAFQITAAAIMVFRADNTTLSVGWLFIAVSIPQVVLSVMFGRLVDRMDRRLLCVLADLVSAVTAFALPLWLWFGGPVSLGSYLANFLLAVTAALFMPASNALVKERVLDGRLGRFNSRYEMGTNSGMLLASSSAGFLIVGFGATPLLVFNAFTFVASAILTWFVGAKPSGAPASDTTAEDAAATTGALAPALRQPIKRLALLYTAGNANLMVSNVILTTIVLQHWKVSPWVIGVVDALAGVGFIIGAACYPWISARIKGLHLAVLGQLGCMTMVIFEPLHYIVLMSVIPVAAFCFANGRIAARTLLMQASPVERVGRIFGGAQAFGLALGVAATVVLSAVADAISVPWAFWGLVVLVDVIAVGTYLSLRKPLSVVERTPEPTEPTEPTKPTKPTEPVVVAV